MASSVIRGTVTLTDGRTLPFAAGMRERIKAERALKVTAADLEAKQIGEEWIAFLMFESLRREGELENIGFEAFVDMLVDYEMSDDDEGNAVAPPAG